MLPARVRYLRDLGFVLRHFPVREGDLLVDLLLPIPGRIRVVAKNATRSQRRFGGCLSVPGRVDVLLAKRGEAWYLEEASLVDSYPEFRRDPVRFALAGYVHECLMLTGYGQEEPGQLTGFLDRSLDMIRRRPDDPRMKKVVFDLKLLELHGVMPSMDQCLSCDAPSRSQDLVGYDVSAGSVVCRTHLEGAGRKLQSTRGVLKALQRLVREPLRYPRAMVLGPRQVREALELTGALIEEHLELSPRSLKVLGQVLRRNRRR